MVAADHNVSFHTMIHKNGDIALPILRRPANRIENERLRKTLP